MGLVEFLLVGAVGAGVVYLVVRSLRKKKDAPKVDESVSSPPPAED